MARRRGRPSVQHPAGHLPTGLTLPPSDDGHYEIDVHTDEASAGCGRPGAEVVLWTYADDHKLYATAAHPWPTARHAGDDPGGGEVVEFDVEFATTDPNGAAGAITELSSEVYDNATGPAGGSRPGRSAAPR